MARPKRPEPRFSVGDVVTLRCQPSPNMVVVDVRPSCTDDSQYRCSWFRGSLERTCWYPEPALAEPEPDPLRELLKPAT